MQNRINAQSNKFTVLWGCRICWKVAAAAFLAILFVEAIVLIPSYRNYALDWQKSRTSEVRYALQTAISLLGSHSQNAHQANASIQQIAADVHILGWRILPSDPGAEILAMGQIPEFQSYTNSVQRLVASFQYGSHMDVRWSADELMVPFSIELRIDTSELQPELKAFVWRIIGLVAIISLFVTIVMVVVLQRLILDPVLRLRFRLTAASEDMEHPEQYIISSKRDDEIGEVEHSFNTMLLNSANSLRTIRENEIALKGAHENLELKVLERTEKLHQEILDRQQIETQLRLKEQHLFQLANYDDLTGLPNRLMAMDRLKLGLRYASRKGCTGALMFIDLDNFKDINDTLGHAKGDELLKQAAQRLAGVIRGTDSLVHMSLPDDQMLQQSAGQEQGEIVARIGGDEFMVILPEVSSAEDTALVASRIREACTQHFDLNGNQVFISTSIGIALFPQDSIDPHELMIYADTALYVCKDEGRNDFRFFSPDMNHASAERVNIERQLRNALDNQEFELHYQPVVNLKTGLIIGMEALLRWTNKDLGRVSPERFIPIAEGSGLIIPIGEWVLQESLKRLRQLTDLGYSIRLAVNVSPRQFRASSFVDLIENLIESNQLKPQQLELEITETLMVEEQSKVASVFEKLSRIGVRLSIDDFGTGYSALGYLRRFSVDTLKIDRSFIADVCTNQQDASLARTIVDMGHNFGLEIIAEGVENEEQLAFLNRYQCDLAQGYYFGKPMPYKALLEQLSSQHQPSDATH